MSTSVWDDPEIRAGGDYIKFDNPGDTVSGTVTSIRAHRFDDGKVVPQVLLVTDDGEEKTMTAGPVRLKAELAEQRPESGDHIKVTFREVEKRAGGKTLKHFDVTVTRGGASAATPEPATAAATPKAEAGVDPAVLAAAVANLSPEQKAALGIPA